MESQSNKLSGCGEPRLKVSCLDLKLIQGLTDLVSVAKANMTLQAVSNTKPFPRSVSTSSDQRHPLLDTYAWRFLLKSQSVENLSIIWIKINI